MKSTPSADHAESHHDDHPELAATQARSGLWLFAVYFLAYAVFMGWAAFSPLSMSQLTPLGANIAIVYGFALIIGAIVVALIYMVICQRNLAAFRGERRSS